MEPSINLEEQLGEVKRLLDGNNLNQVLLILERYPALREWLPTLGNESVLYVACVRGHLQLVCHLLQTPMDVAVLSHGWTHQGGTPLHGEMLSLFPCVVLDAPN